MLALEADPGSETSLVTGHLHAHVWPRPPVVDGGDEVWG
jgi:hypothetical protein